MNTNTIRGIISPQGIRANWLARPSVRVHSWLNTKMFGGMQNLYILIVDNIYIIANFFAGIIGQVVMKKCR